MKTSLAAAGLIALLSVVLIAQDKAPVRTPLRLEAEETNKVPAGVFWTEWVLETNQIPQEILLTTNFSRSLMVAPPQMDFMRAYCPLQHVDTSVQQEITYVKSNLLAFTVWKGRTNRQQLESIVIATNVQRWRWDVVKTYLHP